METIGEQRGDRMHATIAVILLNTFLLFVALNVVLAFFPSLTLRKTPTELLYALYPEDLIMRAYPGKTSQEVKVLLQESWDRVQIFEPYTQAAEAPFHGTYVNVSENGYRLVPEQGAWPPERQAVSVFVFGGSTAFGYGVSDDETIPAYLQTELKKYGSNIEVYNFGRGQYFSTQERILFEELVARGTRPTVVVFIDGLNEFEFPQDAPSNTQLLSDVSDGNARAIIREATELLPLKRAFSFAFLEQFKEQSASATDKEAQAHELIARYETNKKMIRAIAQAYAIETFFVWQPVPFYNSPENEFTRYAHANDESLIHTAYTLVAKYRAAGNSTLGDVIWCADESVHLKGMGYVDRVHYSPELAQRIARCIASAMRPWLRNAEV